MIDLDKIAVDLKKSEEKVLTLLLTKINHIFSRDQIAQALWGGRWIDKYSDWMIDTTIYRLRKKLTDDFEIKTIRNKGYRIVNKKFDIKKDEKIDKILKSPLGFQPTETYLQYMNNPKNIRKTIKDLIVAINKEKLNKYLSGRLLVINSFSFDNIDALKDYQGEVYFTNFDDQALKIHQKRVDELNLKNFYVFYDDVRNSRLRDNSFNTVINDFRLNFNSDHYQNLASIKNIYRVLFKNGIAFISVVIGEKKRYFVGDEGLTRLCFPVEYYRKLFEDNGFKIIKEFDKKEGKNWYKRMKNLKKGFEPTYVRFLLKK